MQLKAISSNQRFNITHMQTEREPPAEADFLTRVIAAVVPAVVAETIKLMSTKEISQYTESKKYGEMVEFISKKLVLECDFDCEAEQEELNSIVEVKAQDTHIQDLKLDLYYLHGEFIEQISEYLRDEIKSELKLELLMEIRKEFELLKKSVGRDDNAKTGASSMAGISSTMFAVTSGANIRPVISGYKSIATLQPGTAKINEKSYEEK